MSFTAMGIFDKLQQREQQRASENGNFGNKHILKLQKGNKYQLRLLYLPPLNCDRQYPMINNYSHSFWDDNASGNKMQVVTCPTSQYLDGDKGFDECEICKCASEYYNDYKKNGTKISEELYKKFKRNFNGYIPVYVVNGPDDVIGKVMILRYGKQLADFLNLKVFGVAPKPRQGQPSIEVDQDDVLAIEAFSYIDDNNNVVKKAYDLIVTVTSRMVPVNDKSVEMPNYAFDFKRNATTIDEFGDIPLTTEYFNTINEELNFDKDFYTKSTSANRENFKLKYIDAADTITETQVEDHIEYENTSTNITNKTIISDEVEQKSATSLKRPEPISDDDEEIDVEKLLENI